MVLTIINQKGGVAKTTTTQAIGQALAAQGYKVLFIDMDPQGNLSQALRADTNAPGLYELLRRESSAADLIQETPGGDLIASGLDLATADIEFTKTGREYLLKAGLKPIRSLYDFILIDTPPALGVLTINALTASDQIIVPLSAGIFALQGLRKLRDTLEVVQEYTNPELKIMGLLLTRYNNRTVLSQDIRQALESQARSLGTIVFETSIREGVAIGEAQAQAHNIISWNPGRNKPAEDYKELTAEILALVGK